MLSSVLVLRVFPDSVFCMKKPTDMQIFHACGCGAILTLVAMVLLAAIGWGWE